MVHEVEQESPGRLPPPWDRIFSLGTRTFVWGLLLAILYILQPFLLLVFLTFVFAYVQAHGVEGLQHRIRNRPLRVTIVGLVFLGTIVATVLALAPQIVRQATDLIDNHQSYINGADWEINDKLRDYPALWDYVKEASEGDKPVEGTTPPTEPATQDPWPRRDPKDPKKINRPAPGEPRLVKALVDSLFAAGDHDVKVQGEPGLAAFKRVFDVGQSVFAYLSAFLLAVLFSFLIVLDLPQLKRGIRGLMNTKVGFIYNEVADNIATFAKVLGRALEAQLFIAVANTILTSIGIWVLGIGNIPVLAAIVFLCSFVPVAGVFISSTPICLLALQTEDGGFALMLMAIVMILVVHAVETYVLNPRIYGHHMRMNPVLVLIVLTVGGKLFGVWGLILGIPIVNYVFRHAIRFPQDQPKEA
ncbi:MAG: AI-2E family transporter [Planctomycetota bacterium]